MHAHRIHLAAALAGLWCAATASAAEPRRDAASHEPAGGEKVEGRVLRAGGEALVLRTADGGEVVLATRDGVPVHFGTVVLTHENLRPGTRVRASYEARDGVNRLQSVVVLREGGAYMTGGSEMRRGVAPGEPAAARGGEPSPR